MGGSDQWGNIVNGIDLGHRMGTPQLYRADLAAADHRVRQRRWARRRNGAVWLNADLLAPYEFWQFWRNTEDADVGRFLKLYTPLPMDEIARLAALGGAEINDAKKVLATEVTALLHGRAAAEEAAETARKTFEEGALADTLPTSKFRIRQSPSWRPGIAAGQHPFVQLASTNGEARRLVGRWRPEDQRHGRHRFAPYSDHRPTSSDGVVKLSSAARSTC